MADSNWQVQLQAIIDTSKISAELKGLAKQTLTVDAKLDLSSYSESMNTMKNMASQVNAEMQQIFSSQGIKIDEKITSGWANEYVQSWQKATQQVQQDINRTLESLNNFSFKNAGFEGFSTEIDNTKVSVADLKNDLSTMAVNGEITGLSKIQNEIKTLESEFTTLSKQAEQSLNSLNNFSISHDGFDSFRTSIDGVEVSVEELKAQLSNMQITGDFSGLENIRSQISSIKTEFEQVSKIQFNVETGSLDAQVSSVVAKTQQWVDANGQAVISTQELTSAMEQLKAASEAYKSDNSAANMEQLIAAQEKYKQALAETTAEINKQNAEYAKTSQVESFYRQVTDWADKNSAAMAKFGTEINTMLNQLGSGAQMPITQLNQLKTEFAEIGTAAREAGDLGQSFGDKMSSAMSKFSYWTSATMIVMQSVRAIREAITTVYDLDTALIDLQKTTTMTTSELEQFYYDANDTAIQMGVTTEEIISQAAAWSRLGYSSNDAATQMAALSSQFASISPGMDTETAQEGLVSTMKAFGIETDDVLDGIMSKINIVGNTAATTNADIIEMLERSSSAMSEANNSLEETIALETAAVEITQNPANVGTAYKTLAARMRGYDEETESYTLDVEELSGAVADLTKTAKTPGGISLFTDETKTEYKSTYQLLKDISEIYDDLDDKTQAELLETLAGFRRSPYVQKCA